MFAIKYGHKSALSARLAHFKPVPDTLLDALIPRTEPEGPRAQAHAGKQDDAFARTEGDDIMLELWNASPKRKIGTMSLHDALRDHIRPGVMLVPDKRERYTLVDIKSKPAVKRKPQKEVYGIGKLLMMNTTNPPAYVTVLLHRAWHFLNNEQPCEFHVTAARQSTRTKRIFDSKARRTGVALLKNGEEAGQFDWKDAANLAKLDLNPAHMLHLRPEVILRAMPEGCAFALTPVANFEEYVFALTPKSSTNEAGRLMTLVEKNEGRLKQIARMEVIEARRQQVKDGKWTSFKPGTTPSEELSKAPFRWKKHWKQQRR